MDNQFYIYGESIHDLSNAAFPLALLHSFLGINVREQTHRECFKAGIEQRPMGKGQLRLIIKSTRGLTQEIHPNGATQTRPNKAFPCMELTNESIVGEREK